MKEKIAMIRIPNNVCKHYYSGFPDTLQPFEFDFI